MLDVTYVLVPNAVSTARVRAAATCLGALAVPGTDACSLCILAGAAPADAAWYDARNVVLAAKSAPLLCTADARLDDLAVSAALDAMRAGAPPPAFARAA